MPNEIDEIRRRAGITENDTTLTDPTAQLIWANVMHAMQDAEEMGGPEGEAYVRLMNAISREAAKRAKTAGDNFHQDLDAMSNRY